MSTEEIDWRSKYKSIKKKLKEIKYLRTTSVRADSEDLYRKIEEHRHNHQVIRDDIIRQNEELSRILSSTQEAKSEIKRLEASIGNLKRSLAMTDSILSVVLNYPSMSVTCVEPGRYRITCAYKHTMTFELQKGKQIVYTPITIPPIARLPDYLSRSIEFESSQLQDFCTQVDKRIQRAE